MSRSVSESECPNVRRDSLTWLAAFSFGNIGAAAAGEKLNTSNENKIQGGNKFRRISTSKEVEESMSGGLNTIHGKFTACIHTILN